MNSALWLKISLAGIVLMSCQKGSDPLVLGKSEDEAKIIKRGQAVYMTNCIACHNTDPRKVGVLGPAIGDASLELLKARVLYAKYPAGYTPKPGPSGQLSNAMPAMPQLEADIPAIHSYFQAMKSQP